jgi:putative ABC transport system permease protein
MNLISVFSLLALVLAVFGLYALLTQIVSQRTREIGVRMALGSSRRGVLGLILRKGMLLVGPGIGIGLVAETAIAPPLPSLPLRSDSHGPNHFALDDRPAWDRRVFCLLSARLTRVKSRSH